jgi:hypothetical protein
MVTSEYKLKYLLLYFAKFGSIYFSYVRFMLNIGVFLFRMHCNFVRALSSISGEPADFTVKVA